MTNASDTALRSYAESYPDLIKKFPAPRQAALPHTPGVKRIETEAQRRWREMKEAGR